MSHTLTGLVSGQKYRIMTRSKNEEGYSEFSELLEKAATELPDPPSALIKDINKSTKNSIWLYWSKVANK